MRAWCAVALGIAALLVPASAMAGGWATVELSSTPDGLAPGETWSVEIKVLQHGQTPLDGVEPSVTIMERETQAERTFPAKPTDRPGVYGAQVVFPGAGKWEYAIHDGFTQTHSYPTVRIENGDEASAPLASQRLVSTADDGPPWMQLGVTLAVGLIAAWFTTTLLHRHRQSSKTASVET